MKNNDINQIKISGPTGVPEFSGFNDPNLISKKPDSSLVSKFEELQKSQSQLREKKSELELERDNKTSTTSRPRTLDLKSAIDFLKRKIKDLIRFIGEKNPSNGSSSFKTTPDKNDFPIFH